ncbi:MAG: LemA family protein [Candidatus Moranbacteria bacterium]|nr:LemA family protein [Candidatus Moranbacteria bacterium]
MKKGLITIIAVAVIVTGYVWMTYNKLIATNEAIDNQWAQVETQYQRRIDLIPNLVESVKGVMVQEQKIFGDLAEARSHYAGATDSNQKAEAATQIDGALSRLLAIMENYPQLKSADNVQTLMAQLEGTENRISVERKKYNDNVNSFNVMIKQIPAKWIASSLGFSEKNYFEAVKGSENTPVVNLK